VEGGFEEPLPPSLRGVAMAQVLLDVGNHPGAEHALAMVPSVAAGSKVQLGASEGLTPLVGHVLQGLQTFLRHEHVPRIDRCHGEGMSHIPMILGDGNDLLALLGG
jgi:hypothetical protein